MSNQDFIKRALFFILAVISVILLWQLRSIVMMGIAALAIAIGVNVPARWLQKRRLGRGVIVQTEMIIKSELDIPAGGLMLFQLAITIVLGALGLLFAVPILAIIITLVREIYSKDILGVGDEKIKVPNTLGEALQM